MDIPGKELLVQRFLRYAFRGRDAPPLQVGLIEQIEERGI
jgi:hypothetical protein